MIIGYIRVSTRSQKLDRQVAALRDRCDRLFMEKRSSVAVTRPQFEKAVRALRCGDTFMVAELDRAFRCAEDALYHARIFRERGIIYKIMDMVVDISTADGYCNYANAAVRAASERMRTSERTIQGLKVARAAGKQLGARPKLTPGQIMTAKRRIEADEAMVCEIAALYGVHPVTITRNIRRLEKARAGAI